MIAAMAAMWMTLAQADPGDEPQEEGCTAQADAQHLSPAARRSFLRKCEGGTATAAATHLTQQEKMKKCNTEAHGMKGDERRHFMSGCLSGKHES